MSLLKRAGGDRRRGRPQPTGIKGLILRLAVVLLIVGGASLALPQMPSVVPGLLAIGGAILLLMLFVVLM